jgi:hypothetical protein
MAAANAAFRVRIVGMNELEDARPINRWAVSSECSIERFLTG